MKIWVTPHDTCRLAVVIMIGFTRDLHDSSFVAKEIFIISPMKDGPIGSLNRKGHLAHFLTFAVNGRITNGLLLYHGDHPPGGVLAIVGSEAKGCCDVI